MLVREGMRSVRELGTYEAAVLMADMAGILGVLGHSERSARLYGAAEALLAALGASISASDRPLYERNLAAARARVDEASWARWWQEGEALSLEQAIEDALAEVPGPSPTARASAPEPAPYPEPAPPVTAAPPALRVRALGSLQLYREGALLPSNSWASARPKELLLYLLTHPGGRTREQIGLVFWPDASAAQIKNSFHVTLHHLRRALGGSDRVVFEEERYRINEALGYEFDATLFAQQMTTALREARAGAAPIEQLRAALDLYRGDFLQEESVGDWHLEMRDRLRRLYIEGLLALGELLMRAERYAEAAEVYQQIVRKEDLQEEAHRRLMLCLARAGERARALRHYERLVALLRTELDAEPEEETTALYERLRRAEPV